MTRRSPAASVAVVLAGILVVAATPATSQADVRGPALRWGKCADIPDVKCWIASGDAPAFLRFEGPLYFMGPVWRIDWS